jgi:uncharacterized membrane protein YraQ (UPF0718 family)
MMIADIVIAGAAVAGAAYTAARDPDRFRAALAIFWDTMRRVIPAVVLAMLAAGLLIGVIPGDLIGPWIGEESGIRGVVVASAVGALIPGGPMISFPLILIFEKAGAGIPQLVALLSGWSVVAIHRLIGFELALMGPVFTYRRLLASAAIPILSGLIAMALV